MRGTRVGGWGVMVFVDGPNGPEEEANVLFALSKVLAAFVCKPSSFGHRDLRLMDLMFL